MDCRIALAGNMRGPTIVSLVIGLASIFIIMLVQQARAADPTLYPPPFNGREFHSADISPFYKWTKALTRMEAQQNSFQRWLDNRKSLKNLPTETMIRQVNNIINGYDYASDPATWGVSDYWETPTEFFTYGGDCEDFAIAKYAVLRALGIAEERLRVAVVRDRTRDRLHAVLIFYLEGRAMILDSEVNDIRDSNLAADRYSMVYSINRSGWWFPAAKQTGGMPVVQPSAR